jgi:hypothetical protein
VIRRRFDLVEGGTAAPHLLDDLVAGFVPDGLGSLFQQLVQLVMASTRSLTLVNTPRRWRRSVSSANPRSTRLSQLELVGVK